MLKRELLDVLYADYIRTFRGNEIVLGDGNVYAKVIIIGEAPGKDEVRLSRPFVGMAGKNLSEFLDILGVKREDIYITNAIKYRLSELNPKTGRVVNRSATKDEITNNRKYIMEEIDIIKPLYVVTLGNVPLKQVTGDLNESIGRTHGEVMKIIVMGKEINLFPLYHPASIIYNRSLKEVYIKDVIKLKEILSG